MIVPDYVVVIVQYRSATADISDGSESGSLLQCAYVPPDARLQRRLLGLTIRHCVTYLEHGCPFMKQQHVHKSHSWMWQVLSVAWYRPFWGQGVSGFRSLGIRAVTTHVNEPMGLVLMPYSLPEHWPVSKVWQASYLG